MSDFENSISVSNFALNWRQKCYRNFQNLESSFWIADSGMNTSFEWFSRFRRGVSHDNGAACPEHSSTRKRLMM
jgi:hypothetical protein